MTMWMPHSRNRMKFKLHYTHYIITEIELKFIQITNIEVNCAAVYPKKEEDIPSMTADFTTCQNDLNMWQSGRYELIVNIQVIKRILLIDLNIEYYIIIL